MDQAMVIVVFLLGIALVIVAAIALFTRRKGEQAELSMLGIKVSGAGSGLFLVVGVVLLLTSKGWSDTLARKGELARAVGDYQRAVTALEQRSAALEARVPSTSLIQLKQQQRQLFLQPIVILPQRVLGEVQRLHWTRKAPTPRGLVRLD